VAAKNLQSLLLGGYGGELGQKALAVVEAVLVCQWFIF